MEIVTRHASSSLTYVKILEGNTTIDLGCLNDRERDELAKQFLCAVWELGPNFNCDCEKWFADMLKKSGIEIPSTPSKSLE